MLVHTQPERAQLTVKHGRERVLDAPMEHLGACRHDADFHFSVWQKAQQRLIARRNAYLFHNSFFNHKRDDAHPCELCPRLHRIMLRDRRDHHVVDVVHRVKTLLVELKNAVDRRLQLDLALFRLARRHVLVLTKIAQDRRRIVLVQHPLVLFPHIEMLLAQPQEHGNVVQPDHIALAEPRALRPAAHNLGNVMAKRHTDRILHTHLTHSLPPFRRCRHPRAPIRTNAAI